MNLLKVENICFSYEPENPILKNISFTVKSGETLGILGPNGGGKSTLMKILSGLLIPTSGIIEYNNIECSKTKAFPYELIAYVPQNNELNTILPVKVSEYLEFTRSLFKHNKNLKTVDEILEKVGVSHKKNSLFSKLSGGEKQRVLIARALLYQPSYLLLDEPTKGLDSNGIDQLLNLISQIKQEFKSAVIIVDHNISHIIKNCDKILCLNKTHHWHDHSDVLTKNILEDIYHCEFEHLLIHERDTGNSPHNNHHFCQHDHDGESTTHNYLRRKK